MRKLLFILICLGSYCLLAAPKGAKDVIDITAEHFRSVGNTTTITGNVRIQKGNDILFSDKVIVYTDTARKPTQYEAIGNVSFTIITNDKRELKGRANKIMYIVKSNEYRLYNNAYVEEVGKPNVLKGDEIVLSGHGDYANIVGKKKAPARVTFTLDKDD